MALSGPRQRAAERGSVLVGVKVTSEPTPVRLEVLVALVPNLPPQLLPPLRQARRRLLFCHLFPSRLTVGGGGGGADG